MNEESEVHNQEKVHLKPGPNSDLFLRTKNLRGPARIGENVPEKPGLNSHPFFLILDLRFIKQRLKPGPNSDLFFASPKSSSEFEVLICKKPNSGSKKQALPTYQPTYLLTYLTPYLPTYLSNLPYIIFVSFLFFFPLLLLSSTSTGKEYLPIGVKEIPRYVNG